MRQETMFWGSLLTVLAMVVGSVVIMWVGNNPQAAPAPTSMIEDDQPGGAARFVMPTLEAPPGWATYVNPTYGFSFRYPAAWSVEEMPGSDTRSGLVRFRLYSFRLTVAYRPAGDPTALGGEPLVGTWEPEGTTPFAGHELRRDVLVQEGRTKSVRYVSADGPLQVAGLEFLVTLHDAAVESCTGLFETECGYYLVDIPADLQAEADSIVSSFRPAPAAPPSADAGSDTYPDWVTYIRASHGFSFRYPPDWTLVEGRNYVALGRGTLNLVIGYRLTKEDVNICCRANPAEGEIAMTEPLICLDQQIDRAVLTCDDKTKAVIYNSAEEIQMGDLMLFITAEDSAPDYDAASIPEDILADIDGIVTSLETFEREVNLATSGPTESAPTSPLTSPPAPTAPPPTITPTPEPARIVTGAGGVNVRSGPGTNYAIRGFLAAEEQAQVTGRYGDWWRVSYEGAAGWVFGEMVSAFDVDSVSEVESPPTPVPASPTLIPTPAPATALDEERWIDVDLSEQRLTAYEGNTPVRTALVSTGLPQTPTVVGQFRIWIKLRYDDMAGPGYYLEDVPYVMYFYQGYGLHGAPWHNNFGNPMSHGCVNLAVPESEWLFGFADVGTLVNVHE